MSFENAENLELIPKLAGDPLQNVYFLGLPFKMFAF